MAEADMPELFDRLTKATGEWANQAPQPFDWQSYELTSERRISGEDPQGHVTVVMDDFKIASIRIDHVWVAEPGRTISELEDSIVKAVNTVLKQYLVEEFTEAGQASLPMGEIHERLKELSADFSAAYARAMGTIEGRTR